MADDPSTRDSVQTTTTTANVTQVGVEEFASIIPPQLRLTQAAVEEWAMVVTLLTTAAQMNGQSDMTVPGAVYRTTSPAAMDGQSDMTAPGAAFAMGAAHMDGQAQFLGVTVVTTSGAAQVDGFAQMSAAGAGIAMGAARMDGLAQGEFDSADMAKGTAQMDGRGSFVPISVEGAAIFEADGQADVSFTSPHYFKVSILSGIVGGQSTSVRMTYVVTMPQTFVGGWLMKPKVRYHLVLSNPINWSSSISFKMKFVQVMREIAIRVIPSTETHTAYGYTINIPIKVQPTLAPKFRTVHDLEETLTLSQTTIPKFIWGRALTEALKVSASLTTHSTYKALLAQLFKFSELEGFTSRHPITLNQNVSLSQLLTGGISVKLLQKLLASGTASPGIAYHLGLTSGVRLADFIDKLFFAMLTELFTAHDVPTHAFTAIGSLNQLLTLHPSFNSKLVLQLTGNIQVSQDQLVQMLYQGDPLLDGVIIDALFISPSGTTTAWAVNTRTNAVTEYLNYDFNSYALLNNRYVAAGAEGLYELDGDTDDGALIISDLMGGYLQLNDKKMFGIKGAYVAIRGGGRFYLKLIAGDGREYVYELRAQPNLMTTKVKVGKGISTTYMAWELVTEGQDFDLDSIEFIPMTRGRRV
jgi:hypothetical protein